jgi:hypothetical protein
MTRTIGSAGRWIEKDSWPAAATAATDPSRTVHAQKTDSRTLPSATTGTYVDAQIALPHLLLPTRLVIKNAINLSIKRATCRTSPSLYRGRASTATEPRVILGWTVD